MKIILKLICIIYVTLPSIVDGQSYYSMVVPVERSVSVHNLVAENDIIWVSGLMFFETTQGSITPGSIVAQVDLNTKEFEFYPFPDYIFSYGTPTFDGNNFYAYADDYNNFPTASMLTLNSDHQITNTYDLEHWNEDSNVLYSKLYENYLFGVSLIQDAEGAKTLLRLNKIDINDSLAWGKTFGIGDKFTTPRGLSISDQGEVFISSGVYHFDMTGPFSQLHKLDQEGNTIWRYESQQEIAGIVAPQLITLLNNHKILITTIVDKSFCSEYISNNWYPLPAKFSWLSVDGMHIRDTIFNTPHVRSTVKGTKTAKTNGVFVYGSWEDEDGEDFGWLQKMTNEGEILWSKKYKHPKYTNTGHRFEIVEFHEYDNGDIIAVGTAQIIGERNEIWVIRLNEHGCFGETDCGEIVTTSTSEIYDSKDTGITIFPNPNLGVLNWESKQPVTRIEIFNVQGERLLEFEGDHISKEIDLNPFSNGFYLIRMSDGKNNSKLKSFILHK